MLCSICQSINIDDLIPPQSSLEAGILSGTQHHASFTELEDAARLGCDLCIAVQSCAKVLITQPAILKRFSRHAVDLKMRLKGHALPGYRGACTLWVSCQGRIIAQLEVYIPRDSVLANSKLKLISGRPVSSNPGSDECFAVANSWIHECMTSQNHVFCQQDYQKNPNEHTSTLPFLPTRLVDVGPTDDSQNPKLILSSTVVDPGMRRYAALSHCWGGAKLDQIGTSSKYLTNPVPSLAQINTPKPLTTLTSNVKDRMNNIPIEVLPRTFRDSVKVTRSLGLRYIWIDSLCIVQDSKSDWEQEAATMADIYKNSYITIAAENSPDSHQGFLKERGLSFIPIEVPLISNIHNIDTTMLIRPALDNWDITMTSPKSKLCSRAWVLQESLLAPRTIHFGEQQMLWECRSRSFAEGDMTPIPPSIGDRFWSWSRNKRFLAADMESKVAAEELGVTKGLALRDLYYFQWYSVLRDYTSRKITFSSDVFPALIGLATEFYARLNDQYVAGLWKGDLHRGLLWSIDEPERAQEIKPYRAPSWSWASIVGQIGRLDEKLHMVGDYTAEIINVQITPAMSNVLHSENHYGEISAGNMEVKGRWKSTALWAAFEEEYYQTHIIPHTEECYGVLFRYFDCGIEERYLERHAKRRLLSLLHIACWVSTVGDPPVAHFLILESGDDGDESAFTRVGVVAMHNPAALETWIEDWEVRKVIVV